MYKFDSNFKCSYLLDIKIIANNIHNVQHATMGNILNTLIS